MKMVKRGASSRALPFLLGALLLLNGAKGLQAAAPSTLQDCPDCPRMIIVPPGSFVMGEDDPSHPEEGPRQSVTLPRSFALGQTAVTFAQWDVCAAAGACRPITDDRGWGRGEQPLINATWKDAQDYASFLSHRTGHLYRLPHEAEWEYAARAGSQSRFWWGEELGQGHANCRDCAGPEQSPPFPHRAAPVRSFPPNGWGFY